MSESDSVLAESATSGDTLPTISDTGTNLPLLLVSAYQDELQRHQHHTLPKLPSHRFRYSVWHDLTNTEVQGSDMKAPRVRYGPPEKEKYFYKLRDDNNQRIHHSRKGRERKDYRDKQENWENTVVASLPYQELGQNYQRDNFTRVLKRLIRVQDLNLFHNDLTDLSSLHFPVCTHLNVSMNYLDSMKRFPKTPRVQHLIADDNYIRDLNGLSNLKKTSITSLSLLRNPVCFTLNYRQRVFEELPTLKILDGVPKQDEDEEFEEDTYEKTSCVIS